MSENKTEEAKDAEDAKDADERKPKIPTTFFLGIFACLPARQGFVGIFGIGFAGIFLKTHFSAIIAGFP